MNGTRNSPSEIEFYLGVYSEMFADLCEHYPSLSPSLKRDYLTIVKRTRAEGIKFLTERLPLLGKEFDYALAGGIFEPVPGFQRLGILIDDPSDYKETLESPLPKLLGTVMLTVLDADGSLRPDPVPAQLVQAIRQITYLLYKLDYPLDKEKVQRALDSFVETEKDLEQESEVSSYYYDYTRDLLSRLFKGFDPLNIRPKHGPGAVATGELYEEKWSFRRLVLQAHQLYPYYEYFVVGTLHLLDSIKWYHSLQRVSEISAKIVTVPKDSRGPRIISMEPLELQYLQQGLMNKLVPWIESHPLTAGRVNFTDQSVNRELARQNSLVPRFATLDMKDASDRVSEEMVYWLFGDCQPLQKALLSLRSTHTTLPDGRVLRLRKYAPMGSALCFPVEALTFWALCVTTLVKECGVSEPQALASVYVYGDDIIVPVEHAIAIMQCLEHLHLKVNRSKCCLAGKFRESCGMDAFMGVPVMPNRIKLRWNQRPSDGSALMHYSTWATEMWEMCYCKSAQYVWDQLEKVYGKLPITPYQTAFPARTTARSLSEALSLDRGRWRYDRELQLWKVRGFSISSVSRDTTLDSWSRVLRNFTCGAGLFPDEVHLSRRCRLKRNSWNYVRA